MATLKEKIEQIKDEHLDLVIEGQIEKHDVARQQAALMLLGGIRAVHRVSDNLDSQVMAALIRFQQEDMHEVFGFKRFADFLDECEHSPMSKGEFYRRKELFETEGGQIYDAFNAARIPLATRKLLLSGTTPIEIDGDELIIGDQRVESSNPNAVKDLVVAIAQELRAEQTERSKSDKKVSDLKQQLQSGKEEYDELRRNLDAVTEQSPFERALTRTVASFLRLIDEAKTLPEADKKRRSSDDLKLLSGQWFRLRDAFGSSIAMADLDAGTEDHFLDRAIAEVAKDDDWGDDD